MFLARDCFSTFFFFFFFFNDPPTTEIYTFSLHDALPIYCAGRDHPVQPAQRLSRTQPGRGDGAKPWRRCRPLTDRKSTRLNSSHTVISYAVFCLKKKKENEHQTTAV